MALLSAVSSTGSVALSGLTEKVLGQMRRLQGVFDAVGNTGPSFPLACSEVVVMSAIKSEDVKFIKQTESKNADQALIFISLLTPIK